MTNPNDDFNPEKEIATLSANFHQPDKFAENFCKVAKTQKSVDEVLKTIIKSLIKEDQETIEIIKEYQRTVDKEDWRYFLKKIGFTGWSLIMIGVGALITATIKKYIG